MPSRRFLFALFTVLALGLLLATVLAVHDIRKIRAMCAAISPGMTVADTRIIVRNAGFFDTWAAYGIPGIKLTKNEYYWPIISRQPFNGVSCDIEHDGTHITSVETSPF